MWEPKIILSSSSILLNGRSCEDPTKCFSIDFQNLSLCQLSGTKLHFKWTQKMQNTNYFAYLSKPIINYQKREIKICKSTTSNRLLQHACILYILKMTMTHLFFLSLCKTCLQPAKPIYTPIDTNKPTSCRPLAGIWHMLGTYLCNWLILWQNALYL